MKRYVSEKGSEAAAKIYQMSDAKELDLSFSLWSFGEAIGAIDQYQRRGWLTHEQFRTAVGALAGETVRLMKIDSLELLPAGSTELADAWGLVRRHHIYQADALQIVACARSRADRLVSADGGLLEAAKAEGIAIANIETRVDI